MFVIYGTIIFLGFPIVNPNKGLYKPHHGATVDAILSYIFFILTRNDNQIATIWIFPNYQYPLTNI